MAEARTRDLSSRDKVTRAAYAPPSLLPDPNPEPGYSFRWIATHVNGTAHHTNVSRQLRDGWEPVKAVDHPELMIASNASGNVEIGGLMLCKQPSDRTEARKQYYDKHASDQMESVDNSFMRNNDPRMPLFADRKSTTTRGQGFGSGSK